MKKKVLLWVVALVAVIAIGGGIYAYNLYSKASNALDEVQQPLKRSTPEKREEKVDLSKKSPISILVIGADQFEDEQGRSDSLLLATANPNSKSMKLVSIPRDTYVEIVGKGKSDKINHAYAFGGVDMTVATVENFLNVPVDYYVEINMAGFQEVVDAVGGVDVVNNLEFTYQGIHFAKGPIHLNGKEALVYSRMRKQDPKGDFGRQKRQRQVIQAVLKKATDASSLTKLGELLTAMQKNVKTNLSQEELLKLQQDYSNVDGDTEEIQIEGSGRKAENGIWYYFVSEETKQQLSSKLREHLELK